MKQIIFITCLFSLITLSCKKTEYQPTGEISAPSQQQIDSAVVIQEIASKEAEKTAPPELLNEKTKRREEKEDDSPFRKVGCCRTDAPPALCCCDAILSSYKEMLTSGDAKRTAELRSGDPLFNDCYKLMPDFKRKIDELELGE